MFSESKYTKWYNQIINNAKKRFVQSDCMESHHILPKSMGGLDDDTNLVLLTFKEHFVCHHLLTKMVIDPSHKQKMAFAYFSMARISANHKRIKVSANTYEKMKIILSETMKEMWSDQEKRNEVSKRLETLWKDESFRGTVLSGINAYWQNPENKERKSKQMTAYFSDVDKRKHLSNIQKELNKNPDFKAMKAHYGETNGMYGKTHTAEAKQAIGEAQRARTKGKTYEELYGKEKAEEMRRIRSDKMKAFRANKPDRK